MAEKEEVGSAAKDAVDQLAEDTLKELRTALDAIIAAKCEYDVRQPAGLPHALPARTLTLLANLAVPLLKAFDQADELDRGRGEVHIDATGGARVVPTCPREPIIMWRRSISDLVTDLRELLDPNQQATLGSILMPLQQWNFYKSVREVAGLTHDGTASPDEVLMILQRQARKAKEDPAGQPIDDVLDERDLLIEDLKPQGIRIIHKPTGIEVMQCEHRSRLRNIADALKALREPVQRMQRPT